MSVMRCESEEDWPDREHPPTVSAECHFCAGEVTLVPDAAPSPDAGIDVERLARAMWATRKLHKDSFATPTAEAVFVAHEYERMGRA